MYQPALADEIRFFPVQPQLVGPSATQRVLALGEARPEELAAALAEDALALIPAARVEVVLRYQEREATEVRDAALHASRTIDLESEPLEIAVRAAAGRVGTIALWPRTGGAFTSADRFAATALSWLAASAVDRVALQVAEAKWERGKRRLDATFSAAPVGIAHISPDGRYLAVNERYAAITGHSIEALLAGGFQLITHPDDIGAQLAHIERVLAGETNRYAIEKRFVRPDGSCAWVNLTVSLVRDEAGHPDFFVSVIEDRYELELAAADAVRRLAR